MINLLIVYFIHPLILTILIELTLLYIVFKDKYKKFFLNIILINAITNLTLNCIYFALILLEQKNINIFIIFFEILIPLIECCMFKFCYNDIDIKKNLLIFYIVNIISFTVGIFIYY